MKTVFLAGGIGKRMAPLTQAKCLISFLGETIIHRHLRLAKKAGLKDFIIVANPHNKEALKENLKDFDNTEFIIQEKPHGMGNALLQTKKIVAKGPILVVGGDEIFEYEAYEKILKAYKTLKADSYILAEKVESYFPGGYLKTDNSDRIRRIIEKPGPGNEPSDLVNLIMHLHSHPQKLFKLIESVETTKDDEYEQAMDQMLQEFAFKAVPYSGWQAMKYPWHILEIMDHFLGKIDKKVINENVEISNKAQIDGSVWIKNGSKILEGAIIRGPTYIGKNAVIGNNTLVRNAHICDNTVIGFGSEIKHSYLSEKNSVHDAYVGDSVLDANCNLGAGTVLANWRFDEKEVHVEVKGEKINTHKKKLGAFIGACAKTGVNSSVMPGRKLGKNSRLGANIALYKNLGKNETLLNS